MIVIVGAGLAGLVCARVLQQQGLPVTVLERESSPGGRVRTEVHPDGYRLDRGFQVLFTAYPSARRHLSFARLALRPFTPGALIARNGRLYALADPRREPGYLFSTAFSRLFGLGDKLRVARLSGQVRRTSTERIFSDPDTTTEQYLRTYGFSPAFIEGFARPFYAGIFLDRSLSTSSAMFRFTFKMLTEGQTVVPARGMQQISEQLAASLPPRSILYDTPAESLIRDSGRVLGVRTLTGGQMPADTVVVATDPHTAVRLLGGGETTIPHTPVSCTTVYFATPTSLYNDRMIVLNANPEPYVNHLVQLTNISAEYAPAGRHLLSLTILQASEDSDVTIEQRCRADLAAMFPKKPLDDLRLLRIMRIPFAQFAQPPGIFRSLPGPETPLPNVYLASEATVSSSIEGAMRGGEAAAQQILAAIRAGGKVATPGR
jgi:phytoene dehydrogenase-like protein